jgi:O-antigen/teichoic acid export membrane protein
MIIACTGSAWWFGKPPAMVLATAIASCGVLAYAVAGPLDSVMIAEERLDLASAMNLLNQAVFIVLGTLLLVLGAGYVGLALASLIAVLAMALASWRLAAGVLRCRFERPDPRRWQPLLRTSLPFGVIGITGVFARRFDTVFMSFVLTDAAVGWYNVPYQLTVMTLLLAQGLAISMYPALIKQYHSGHGSIQGTVQAALRYVLLASLPLAVGGMLLADRIIVVLYGQPFAPAAPVMQVLIWTLPPLFLAEILGRTSSTMHREKQAARASVIRAVMSGVLIVVLVPRFGVMGAAVATLLTRLVATVQSAVIIGPATLLEGNVGPLLRVIGAGAVMGGVVWRLRDVFLTTPDDKIALLVMIAIGAAVYGAAALALRAIRPSEARYVYDAGRRGLAQLGRAK